MRLFEWWRIYKRSRVGMIGLIMVIVLVVVILLAPIITTHDPAEMITTDFLQSPSWNHPLGTTVVGQDVFSQLLYSGRVSLTIGLVVSSIVVTVGCVVGLISGYFGGMVDELMMRLVDVIMVLPRLPLMIVLAAYLDPGFWTIVFVLSVVGWAGIARQIRSQTLSCKEYTFVEAARALGAGDRHIIVNHILPNLFGIVIANFVMEIVFAILIESGLSFLGLGDPLRMTWGTMLYFAQAEGAFSLGAWWWVIPPGLAIALIGASFSFIGNTVNDRFVLRLARRGKV